MDAVWWETVARAPAQTSILAFVTTIHCTLVVLRDHRPRGDTLLVLLPSVVFAASPWFLSTPLWLVLGLGTHLAWFVACEKLIPAAEPKVRPATPVNTSAASVPTPAPAPAPAKRAGFDELPVLAVLPETPEIRTFRFARPVGFEFTAGQFVMVSVEIEGKPLVRCYSISSAPSTRGYLEISVRNQGIVSGFLHATVRPGTKLKIQGPGGTFVYPEGRRPIVLIAGGIGITPLLSMLRHALASDPDRVVTLVLSAKTEAQVPFLDELRVVARRHPRLRLAIALSQGSESDEFFSGRIDRALLDAVIDSPKESVCLLCGPLPMIDGMRALLAELGVPPAQIHYEKFEVAQAGATAAATATGSITMRLQKCDRVIQVGEGQSVLDAAEAAGVEIPSMCRAGVCGTCVTQLIEGKVEGEFDVLDEDERAQGFILACVARPVTNCVVDA